MSKYIELSQDKRTLVDVEDYEYLNQFKWYYNNGYAVRSTRMKNGKRGMELMHRTIVNAPKGMEVDHINGDKLENKRSNLRLCTHTENLRNQHKTCGTSKYKGVCWHKAMSKWRVQIRGNNKKIHLGFFDNEEDAAHAYNMAALELFGEFANLNKGGEL